MPVGTYPAPAAGPVVPAVYQTPGAATLNPQQGALGSAAPGGVPGVAMAPMTPVTMPARTGGPHALPALPQFPLPQGFPNPFSVQQVPAGGQQQPISVGPGSTVTTGPAGHMPGIGTFGSPGGPGLPQFPGPLQGHPGFGGPGGQGAVSPALAQAANLALPTAAAPAQAAPAAPVTAPAQAQPAGGPAQPHPFWLQMAWQLIQAPAVRTALGDRFAALAEGEKRLNTLQVAAGCLAGPELQAAFKKLTGGGLTQSQFIDAFAGGLKNALQATGALA